MLHALERIAVHTSGYAIYAGTINATSTPTTPSPAATGPSANDIRVNVLWFASLMISLIAASFAIVVKQWLREYLSVQSPAPQARLRVRHLRYPQLSVWKVFEIAAILPLLLQLSLGLFFVGMCYFTSAIHSSIGYTTLPLVIGWALCFLCSAALPFIFPRCPYRTPLLKGVAHSWHGLVSKVLHASYRHLVFRTPPRTSVWQKLHSPAQQICELWRQYLERSDEVRTATYNKADIAILASADAIQANDELLGTTIMEAFLQVGPVGDNQVDRVEQDEQVELFVASVLQTRAQVVMHPHNGLIADFSLSPTARTTLSKIILRQTAGCRISRISMPLVATLTALCWNTPARRDEDAQQLKLLLQRPIDRHILATRLVRMAIQGGSLDTGLFEVFKFISRFAVVVGMDFTDFLDTIMAAFKSHMSYLVHPDSTPVHPSTSHVYATSSIPERFLKEASKEYCSSAIATLSIGLANALPASSSLGTDQSPAIRRALVFMVRLSTTCDLSPSHILSSEEVARAWQTIRRQAFKTLVHSVLDVHYSKLSSKDATFRKSQQHLGFLVHVVHDQGVSLLTAIHNAGRA